MSERSNYLDKVTDELVDSLKKFMEAHKLTYEELMSVLTNASSSLLVEE